MRQTELDQAMHLLTENKNIQIKEIVKRLGIERTAFNSWRRSSQEKRRRELLEKLVAAYPEHFAEGIVPTVEIAEENTVKSENKIDTRYIDLLERNLRTAEHTLQAVQGERDQLRKEVAELIERIKKESS